MSNWASKVDFAFVTEDKYSFLSLMYVEHKFIPDIVRNLYTEDSYNQMTGFIIDEISGINSEWPQSDLSRGFYVYEYIAYESAFKKVGEPEAPLKSEKISKFKDLIIGLEGISFKNSSEVFFG